MFEAGLCGRCMRTFTHAVFALWFGGVTFYALFVIPAGRRVLGSHTAQGFVTREVSIAMQWVGAIAIALLWVDWQRTVRGRRQGKRALLALLALTLLQAVQFVLHPWLDALLDAGAKHVVDASGFYLRHRVYLLTTAALFIVAAWYLHSVLLAAIPRPAYDAGHEQR